MPVIKQEKVNTVSLCTVVLSIKSLLLFAYEVMKIVANKVTATVKKANAIRQNALLPEVNEDNNNKEAPLKELKEMPGPRSLPFFGTLLTSEELKSSDLMKANEAREKKYGSVVREEHFWNYPFIMVLGTEDIKKVIRTNSIIRPGMEISIVYRNLRPDRYNSHGLVNSQGAAWKRLHSIFSTVTTNRKFVRSLQPVFNDIVTDVANSMSQMVSPTGQLPTMLNSLITEASFYTTFGKRMGFVGGNQGIPEKMSIFSNCHENYWNAFHKSMYGFPWWKYFPTKVWKEFTAAEDKMIEMIDEIANEMIELGQTGGVLAAVSEDKLTRNERNVVLLELITGATEPVYYAVLITLYWITRYEHVYHKVLEELREQLPTKDSPVDESVLDNIPYLKACVMETFRICPTACNVARVLDREMEIGGYRMPAYTPVILQTWHACLKETSFYRAKEFIPERWLLEDGIPPFRPHEPHIMSNFGIGTRACPGRKIASQLINTFLCKILRKFQVKFTKDIKLEYEWLLVVKGDIIVDIAEYDA